MLLSKFRLNSQPGPAAKTSGSLERIVREAIANKEYEKIRKIVDQLCHEYAYAVHQPHARNGGLIGLAAASIALGSVCPWAARYNAILANGYSGGGCPIPERDCPPSASMLHRSRCESAVLCLREYV